MVRSSAARSVPERTNAVIASTGLAISRQTVRTPNTVRIASATGTELRFRTVKGGPARLPPRFSCLGSRDPSQGERPTPMMHEGFDTAPFEDAVHRVGERCVHDTFATVDSVAAAFDDFAARSFRRSPVTLGAGLFRKRADNQGARSEHLDESGPCDRRSVRVAPPDGAATIDQDRPCERTARCRVVRIATSVMPNCRAPPP